MIGLAPEERARVAAAARAWLETPFHPDAMLRGVGVDCGRLLLAVYLDAGIVSEDAARAFDAPSAPAGWHLHKADDRYERIVAQFAVAVDRPWQVGDMLLIRGSRWPSFGHGAILVAQDRIIHAISPRVVEWPLTSPWFRSATVRAWRIDR